MAWLTERGKQALDAKLWRTKTILNRNKRPLFRQFLLFLTFCVITIILQKVDKQISANIQSSDSITVTTSNPIGSANYFNQTNLTSNFSLPNCSISPITQNVGFVLSDQASYYEQLAIQQINEMISAAFTANNPTNPQMQFQQFQTQESLFEFVSDKNYVKNQFCFGYSFSLFDLESSQFDFQLYFDTSIIGATNINQTQYQSQPFFVQQKSANSVQSGFIEWQTSGFQQLMTLATSSIINTIQTSQNQSLTANFAVAYLPMNTGSFIFSSIGQVVVMLYLMSIIEGTNLSRKIIALVNEPDEMQLSTLFRLSGMSVGVEILYDWIIAAIIIVPITLILAFLGTYIVVSNISFGVVFLLILSYNVQIKLVKTILTYGVDRGIKSLFLNIIYYLLMIFVTILVGLKKSVSKEKVMIASFFMPNLQLQYFFQFALIKDQDPTVSSQINIAELGSQIYDIPFRMFFIIGAIDTILYSLILLYLWPLTIEVQSESKLPWYYPFTKSYWQQKQPNIQIRVTQESNQESLLNNKINETQQNLSESVIGSELLQDQELQLVEQGVIEKLRGDESSDKLQIIDLTKKFGSFVAVENLTLTMFKDQILVLLGHNGAGKTTTINMLIGQIKPTSGSALSYGIDLTKESSTDLIQVCTQHNVLIGKMTVLENLIFFSKFRGVKNLELAINQLLDQFKMQNKRDSFCDKLSGGQKRKLQLMISFLGNSKIVLLDEPSSGMDPSLRRETWKIIQKLKKGKIIIMTTHYMDEAEQLGDRVAIMSHGKLNCCGTPLFLKNKFSNSFLINIAKEKNDVSLDKLQNLIKMFLQKIDQPNFELKGSTDEIGQTVFNVPRELGPYFEQLFHEIDVNKQTLNIKEYTVRTSSLEEVFIQIGENEKTKTRESQKLSDAQLEISDESSLGNQRTQFDIQSDSRIFMAFLQLNFRSSIGAQIVTVFITLIFSGLFALTILLSTRQQPSLPLTQVSKIFPTSQLPLNSFTNSISQPQQQAVIFMDPSYFQQQDVQCLTVTAGDQISTNVSQTLQNWSNQLNNQYGGVNFNDFSNGVYGYYYVQNLPEIPNISEQLSVAVYGNLRSITSQNVFGSLVLNQIAQYYTQQPTLQIQFTNQPLKPNVVLYSQDSVASSSSGAAYISTITIIFMSILLSLIGKRFDSGFYNQLIMKSGNKYLYFLTIYLIEVLVHFEFILIFNLLIYWVGVRAEGFWLASILYILTNPILLILINYYVGFVKREQVNRSVLIIFSLFALTLLSDTIFLQLQWTSTSFQQGVNYSLILGFIPTLNLINSFSQSLLRSSYAQWNQVSVDQIGKYELMKPYIVAQFICLILYSVLLFAFLRGWCVKKSQSQLLYPSNVQNEDQAVKNERDRLKSGAQSKDIVRVIDVVKKYEESNPNQSETAANDRPNEHPQQIQNQDNSQIKKQSVVAVDGISFGVAQGETMALLGLTGAGKSSTFNMLLGEEQISGGTAFIGQNDANSFYRQPENLHGLIGYCPQTNSIEDGLTVRQSIYYFCDLVGVKKDTIQDVVNHTIRRFDLEEHVDKRAGSLSGGNKRKLTCAQAMIGNPKVIFVDEVSAGVDPVARRKVWQGMRFESQNSALILTTHTLEEAEALAQKIGIMVSGKLKCFGSLQDIQQTFGSGFEIEMNLQLQDLNLKLQEIDSDLRFSSDCTYIQTKLQEWQSILEERGVQIAINFPDEFSLGGIYSVKYENAKKGDQIDLVLLQKDIQVQNEVARLVQELSEKISETSVISFDGSYLVLRLAKQESLTSGQLYGFMEKMKFQFAIKEYSCKQATLEQIFNAFAKEDNIRVFNARVSQKRQSRIQS